MKFLMEIDPSTIVVQQESIGMTYQPDGTKYKFVSITLGRFE